MQIGDWVKHKEQNCIGQIIDEYVLWTSSKGITDCLMFRVRFYDERNRKYTGIYGKGELIPHQLEKSAMDDSLNDWLSTPNQKLRSALAKKKEKNRLANLRKPEQRLDWRGRGR